MKFLVLSLLISLAIGLQANAQSYSQDFDGFANGTTDLGDGSVMAGTASVQDGALELTRDGNSSSSASFSIPAISGSSLGWTATFELIISDAAGGLPPGDGMSLNYGNAQPGELGAGEEGMEGITAVTENLSFEIDTWMNADAEQGVNIAQKVGGTNTDIAFTNGPILADGATANATVQITYSPANGVSFITTGLLTDANFSLVPTTFAGADTHSFILSARAGGASETLLVDNLTITTNQLSPVVSITANDNAAAEGATDTATFLVERDGGGTDTDLAVDVAIVTASTDAAEADYTLSPPLAGLVIPAGSASVTVTMTATDDDVAETDEDLTLEVRPNASYTVGVNKQAGVFIEANDFGVTNTDDFDVVFGNPTAAQREGTLRQAIENANDFGIDAVITFADDPFASGPARTILLVGGELVVEVGLTIQGPGADLLTLQGAGFRRILHFSDENETYKASASGLSFVDGDAVSAVPAGRGGAIYAGFADGQGALDITITECAFSENRGDAGGAIGFASADGQLAIERCLFDNNTANTEGGALAFYDGLGLRITDSTFANNQSSGAAGAMLLAAGSASIVNATIVGNRSDEDDGGEGSETGGGLAVGFSVECTLHNTIVAGNLRGRSTPSANDIDGDVESTSRNNLIGDPASAGGLVHDVLGNQVGMEDPENASQRILLPLERIVETEFVVLGQPPIPRVDDHGGLTRAVRLDRASPAIEQGDPSVVMSEFDQRGDGFPRDARGFPDFSFTENGSPDIGAIEFDPILVTTVTDEDDGTPAADVGDGTSLREAIGAANSHPGSDLILFSRGRNNTINFYDAGAPKVMRPSNQFSVSASLDISGPGAELLTIDGDVDLSGTANDGDTRLFSFEDPIAIDGVPDCALEGVTLANGSQWATGNLEDGGAISNSATLLLIDIICRNNSARAGGAIFNAQHLNLIRAEISSNNASGGGGGIFTQQTNGNGFATIQLSTFVGNTANRGGGIFMSSGNIQLLNTTISRNGAADGGGIFYDDGFARSANCTIAQNTAFNSTSGGGIHFSGAITTPTLELDNTIVAGNANALTSNPSDIAGGPIAGGSIHNLIGDANSSGGLIDGTDGNVVGQGGSGTILFSEILEPLADNGGFTQTHLPAFASLAIDNGDGFSATFRGGTPLRTDQRGEQRIVGFSVDIGSVELQDPLLTIDPINDQFVAEEDLLEFTATATDNSGTGSNILFSLEDGASGFVPGNADIDPGTGEFTWPTDESDGPGFYQFDVVATLEDDPSITARQTVFVDVFEVNTGPMLDPISDKNVTAGLQLAFTATASDLDIPQNSLSFSLDSNSENLGMQINPATGEFQWTPINPGNFPVTITVEDDGDPVMSDSTSFNIEVSPGLLSVVSLNAAEFVHEPNSFSKSPPLGPFLGNVFITRSETVGDLSVALRIDEAATAGYNTDFTVSQIRGGQITPVLFSGSPLEAMVTIPNGLGGTNLSINAVDDPAAEADESVPLSLLPSPNYTIGTGAAMPIISQNDYLVTDAGDFDPIADPNGGEGTLRQAILNAKAGLTLPSFNPIPPPQRAEVRFASGLPDEIVLSNGALLLDTVGFDITGPGSGNLAISGGGSSRVFIAHDPSATAAFAISGLRISNGFTSGNGGGIFNSQTLRLNDCTISGCLANNGGGISNEGTLVLQNSAVAGNSAVVYGGGIDNFSGNAFVGNSTIAANSAAFGGGIEHSGGGAISIENSTVANNSASSSGGGIDFYAATGSVINSTVSGNSAGYGGGLFNEQGTVTIAHSTIANNSATSSTGGLLCSSNAPAGNTLVHNSIIAGNPGGDIGTANPSFVNVDPDSDSNLVGDAASSGGLVDGVNGNQVGIAGSGMRALDSIVAPLADNGGPTLTHALVEDGPAVDRGNNQFAKRPPFGEGDNRLVFDQRGFPFDRVFNDVVDIGAFEWSPQILEAVSCELSDGPTATITWRSTEGESYDVLCSTDLKNWQLIASGVPANGSLTSYTDETPPAGQAYFIIRPSKAGEKP